MTFPFDSDVLITWVAILLIVFMVFFFTYLGRRAKYRVLEKLAEKGQTLSPEILAGLSGKPRYVREEAGNPIGSGITLMCTGVALALFFWAMQGWGNPFMGEPIGWLPAIGLFPFMAGLARVLSTRYAGHDSRDKN